MSLEDRAQEHEAVEWAMRNGQRAEGKTYAPGEPGYGPAECEECDEPMPTLRRANGWSLCTACKAAQERFRARR